MRTADAPADGVDPRFGGEPIPVDAALQQTIALLELVSREEVLLGRLSDCLAQLHAISRARAALLDVTDTEIAEAREATRATTSQTAIASAPARGAEA